MQDLPPLALSVRQPWAWAIVAGHKRYENRSPGAIRSGRMTLGPIAIHAATGLKQAEFTWGHWRLARHGVVCPRPETLIRGAIIGTAEVVDIVDHAESEWFGGPMALVLENARRIDPIPAKGALGYFPWRAEGQLPDPFSWMHRFDPVSDQPGLFEDLPLSYRTAPSRPRRKS